MFVGMIITIYQFMNEPTIDIHPAEKVLQFISMSIAPATIMFGTSFMLTRKFGSRLVGSLIITGGIIVLVGMFVANTLVDDIDKSYRVYTVTITPPLFMLVSIPIMIFGALLFRLKKRPKKYF
jgi:dolichyl-phosphate-mannose--protein O-mannosyl transferase